MTADGGLDLTDRRAIVTGAGSGIGRAAAVELAGAGAFVLCGDINGHLAEECVDVIRRSGGRAIARRLDVRIPRVVDEVVGSFAAEGDGRLDIMANIAGAVVGRGPVADISDEDLDNGLDLNLKSLVYGTRAAGRIMRAQGSGSIVNMSSGTVDGDAPGIGAYSIAKAGVLQLTRTAAMELGSFGVRVNTVSPGYVETPMSARHYTRTDGTIDEARRAQIVDDQVGRIPLGRAGRPEEVGRVIRFLASDAASYVTGQVIRVNGGMVMPL